MIKSRQKKKNRFKPVTPATLPLENVNHLEDSSPLRVLIAEIEFAGLTSPPIFDIFEFLEAPAFLKEFNFSLPNLYKSKIRIALFKNFLFSICSFFSSTHFSKFMHFLNKSVRKRESVKRDVFIKKIG